MSISLLACRAPSCAGYLLTEADGAVGSHVCRVSAGSRQGGVWAQSAGCRLVLHRHRTWQRSGLRGVEADQPLQADCGASCSAGISRAAVFVSGLLCPFACLACSALCTARLAVRSWRASPLLLLLGNSALRNPRARFAYIGN